MDQLRHSKALEELLANCSQNGPQVNQNWTKKHGHRFVDVADQGRSFGADNSLTFVLLIVSFPCAAG